jgi:hypothetical protein
VLVQRVRVSALELREGSGKARRRRAVPKGQLKLALRGRIEHTYASSLIVTDLPGEAVAVEYRHRLRAQIKEGIKDLKLGCGLHHPPLRRKRANQAWQAAAVIATSLISMLSAIEVHRQQQLARAEAERRAAAGEGVDAHEEIAAAGQSHNTPFPRWWLINLPARVLRSARRRYLRLAPSWRPAIPFAALYHHLQLLPAPG